MPNFQDLLSLLRAQLDKPYVFGDEGPDSFDCSGLMQYCFKQALNINLPRTSKEQYGVGLTIDKSQIAPGDLIFFDTGASSTVPNHVGVCTEIGTMINANSYNNKVVEESYTASYWEKAFYGARRILDETITVPTDLIASTEPIPIPPKPEPVETSPFSDVDINDPFYSFIIDLYNRKVIAGYPDGTFKPEQGINRAEVLKVILLAFEIGLENGEVIFPDVKKEDWFYAYVATAFKKGIVQGYPDGTFKPGNLVTRVEALHMILKTAGITLPTTGDLNFEDVKPEQWFYYDVVYALDKKLIEPLSSTKFGSGEAMKREEVCKAVSKISL